MRVISQNGRTDLPYENTVISISELSSDIYAYVSGASLTKIAEYSTPEKAQKAMELLHQTYTGMLYLENCEIPQDTMKQLEEMYKHGFGVLAIKEREQNVTFEPMKNICFRFPPDDEIE